ncbi:chromosome partitioning protein ParA [Priestia megaterium]|uniref:FtsK/SpoIIIE domain-containing protein n=1 Tax=Priestia megaterium TaxID=1404 RepID=UPI000BF8535D|nr:FtsK/SpoIIIE domain-containing protein [Priestia megaterium]MDP1442924.1 FtsK/SpoIIIE domain-containing protein [Priestia megaterium]MDP1472021.1 FtsK/SpoIIIE domain-containing protein [Priestia megaterium]PFO19131.1 chromosome partitioning protein ParA [Priestia megaterium]
MFEKLKLRGKLIKAFRTAEIYRVIKRGDRTSYQFPKIHRIDHQHSYTRYAFSLLNGIDPELLTKKRWALRQVLGSNIEVNGSLKNFSITVHHKNLPKMLNYCYEVIHPHIEKMELPVCIGQDIYGNPVSWDFADLETLLISGEIGAGKSSLMRVILTTWVKYSSPEDLRLVLVDLKRADLGLFHEIDHVGALCFEAKDMRKPFALLRAEMYRRGDLLLEHGVTHISRLPFKLPRIVVVIDEMSIVKRETDLVEMIQQFASQGRALGVHTIIAMQRPDADLLNSALKANLRVRISGRQADAINAKVAGVIGAEEIDAAARGRMKIKIDDVKEFQAFFLDEEMCKKLLSPYKTRVKDPEPQLEVVPEPIFGLLEKEEQR